MEAQAIPTTSAVAEDPMRQRLKRALERFDALPSTKPDHRLFIEVDIATIVPPEDLITRQIRVYWADDDAWYLGTVTAYDDATAAHRVHYDDGTIENVVLAIERVRLVVSAGEDLSPAPPSSLRAYAASLMHAAKAPKAKHPKELTQRAEELFTVANMTESEAAARVLAEAKVVEAVESGAATNGDDNDARNEDEGNTTPAQQQDVPAVVGSQPTDDALPPPPASRAEAAAAAAEIVHKEQDEEELPLHQRLRIGEVIWAKVNGFPHWPALVVTREHAINGRTKLKDRQLTAIPLVYFGTFERQLLKATAVTPLGQGLTAGFCVAKTIKRRQFASSLCEVAAYLEDGEIPEGMFPSNDEIDDDEEDNDEEDGGNRTAKRRKSNKNAKIADDSGVIKIGKFLTVTALGRVEWLHPRFHNEKAIWPVGYRAERIATTPAGGSNAVVHLCEIVAAPDGTGPLFR